jgi:hypothetical protein
MRAEHVGWVACFFGNPLDYSIDGLSIDTST